MGRVLVPHCSCPPAHGTHEDLECGLCLDAAGGREGSFHIVSGFNKTKPLTASLLQLLVLPREVLVSTAQG